MQIAAYAMLFPPGPFPLMCVAFALIGFGLSLQNAHCNGYVAASKENVPTKIGYLHASYGMLVPLACIGLVLMVESQAVGPSSLRLLRPSSRSRAIGHTTTSSLGDCTQ